MSGCVCLLNGHQLGLLKMLLFLLHSLDLSFKGHVLKFKPLKNNVLIISRVQGFKKIVFENKKGISSV